MKMVLCVELSVNNLRTIFLHQYIQISQNLKAISNTSGRSCVTFRNLLVSIYHISTSMYQQTKILKLINWLQEFSLVVKWLFLRSGVVNHIFRFTDVDFQTSYIYNCQTFSTHKNYIRYRSWDYSKHIKKFRHNEKPISTHTQQTCFWQVQDAVRNQ